MNRPADIFTLAVMDNAMIAPVVKVPIARIIIGRDQADLMRHSFLHEIIKMIIFEGISETDTAYDLIPSLPPIPDP